MANKAERKVLDMVKQGQISAVEGLRLIKAMGDGHQPKPEHHEDPTVGFADSTNVVVEDAGHAHPTISPEEIQRMQQLKRWWVLPFVIGLLITTLGAIWMYSAYAARGFSFGFWLAWLPFLIGIFIVAVSFQTSRSVWLHLRVKQKPGESPQRISISLPVPVKLTRWFFNTFGQRIPGLRDQPLGDYSDILENLSPEEPFYVHVNEDDGEEVEVFIG